MEKLKEDSEVRWKEHEDPAGSFYKLTWKVLSIAPSHFCSRKILEAFFIALRKPTLNDQLEHHSLSLFPHDIT